MRRIRQLGKALGTTTAVGGLCVALERSPLTIDAESFLGRITSPAISAVRFTRSLCAASLIALDYKTLHRRFSDYDSDEYKRDRAVVHSRTGVRLLKLAKSQGVIYVKIGQHLSSMNHTVPKEYIHELKTLEDHASYKPYWQIKHLLQPYEKHFGKIEETPTASASLAQVHKATLKNSTEDEVAIKIQYPNLQSLINGDLICIQVLSRMLQLIFPFFNIQWLINEFKVNLKQEIDFENEAQNAQLTSQLFQNNKHIQIPQVHPDLSSKNILVMDYIDGFRIDDVEAMEKAGIDKNAVAYAVVDAFAQMIYVHGHVHMDPHGGNIMVRPKGEKGDFEIFLLDHGLYRELSDEFRHTYCKLWKGLVLRRKKLVSEACKELGGDGLEDLFSMMLLSRTWKSISDRRTDIRQKMSAEEIKQLKKDLRKESGEDVSSLIDRIPDDLWLVFKMNSLVRNVNKSLGASVNRLKMFVRYAVKGLNQPFSHDSNRYRHTDDDGHHAHVIASTHDGPGLRNALDAVGRYITRVVDRMFVEFQLLVLDVFVLASSWREWTWSSARSKQFKESLTG